MIADEPSVDQSWMSQVNGDIASMKEDIASLKVSAQQNTRDIGMLTSSVNIMQQGMLILKDGMNTVKDIYLAQQKASQERWNNIKSYAKQYWLHILFGFIMLCGAIYGLGYLMGANHMQPLVNLPGIQSKITSVT